MRYNFINIVAEVEIVKQERLVQRCTCDAGYHEDHTCPYSEEINNDYESLCNCCSYCQQQCAYDI